MRCQQTDTSLFTQPELGLFFCFLETSFQSSIILSLRKTVAPAERNSAYGPNTVYVVLFLKEIFFFLLHLTCFSSKLNGSDLPIQEHLGSSRCLSNQIRFLTRGPIAWKPPVLVTLGFAFGQLEDVGETRPAWGQLHASDPGPAASGSLLLRPVRGTSAVAGETICWLLPGRKNARGL